MGTLRGEVGQSAGSVHSGRVDATDLAPSGDAVDKARSVLIAHAYAAAYCTVLTGHAHVVAIPLVEHTPTLSVPIVPGSGANASTLP